MRTYEEKQLADWLAYSNAELPLLLRHNIFVRSDQIQERGGGRGGGGGGEDQQQRKIEMDLKGRLGWTTTGQFARGYSWVMVRMRVTIYLSSDIVMLDSAAVAAGDIFNIEMMCS